MDVSDLTPLEQTAFLTLYARALDSRWPRPILGDKLADNVVANIDYDFAAMGVTSSVVCQSALRAKMLDDRVRKYVAEHPDAVVVDLGAGLDDGMYRVNPPPTSAWYSVDLPAVIALRDKVLPGRDQAHSVAASLADPEWPDSIPSDRPTLLVADGVLAFLSEPVIVGLFRRITDHFRTGELAFNFSDVASQWGYAGFRDAHHPETWNPRLKLVEEVSLAHAPEVELFPGWIRVATRLSGKIPAMARKARILRYRF